MNINHPLIQDFHKKATRHPDYEAIRLISFRIWDVENQCRREPMLVGLQDYSASFRSGGKTYAMNQAINKSLADGVNWLMA